MKEKIAKIEKEAKEALAKIIDIKELNELKIKYLGKKSELSNVLKDMANLSKEERPIIRRNSK
jgi:phenylalanyl-tRNA synthetase alpha chain